MAIDERSRLVLRARETVLTSSERLSVPEGVSPLIVESWRRSLMYGLEPDRCAPRPAPCTEAAHQLRRVSAPIIEQRRAALAQSSCSLTLTDASGRILNRWVEDNSFASLLDHQSVMPEFSVAETATGTSGGIVLETGQPVTVAGPEHFREKWFDMTCAAAPIRHPITRRLIGSLVLTVRYIDTTPFLQSWVTGLALEVERALLDNASRREQLLMAAYLAENRDTRHPVLCLDDQTVISNAPAARMLNSVDQALLWEHASNHLQGPGPAKSAVTLSDGIAAEIDITSVRDGDRAIGAVVRIRSGVSGRTMRIPTVSSQPVDLPGLVGRSEAWHRTARDVHNDESASMLLTGESGVGKFAIASASAHDKAAIIDFGLGVRAPADVRVDTVRHACASGAPQVLLRHIEAVDDYAARTVIDILDDARHRGVRILATMTTSSGSVNRTPLFDWFDSVVKVPSLAERNEDLPLLLDALTARHISGARTVRWLPDAVQTLSRLHWPRNVSSLDAVVRDVLARNRRPTIGANDLPPELRAQAGRRALVGLEHVEAKAIMEALHNARGNKRLAADSLGIARSTLYRKVRALGIDLSKANF